MNAKTPEEKLEAIAEILGQPTAPVDAGFQGVHFNNRELTAADPVVADGNTVNSDGSRWGTSKGEAGPAGTIYQAQYGFISERKNPEVWAGLQALFGPEMWKRWNIGRNPWTIYKVDPRALLKAGVPNVTAALLLYSDEVYRP